jgi:GT2 family glycosyltransferase
VIEGCLDSLQGLGAVVVDNASTDGTADLAERKGAKVIRNKSNLGFAAAINQGVRSSTASYLIMLNPDTVLLTDWRPLLPAANRSGLSTGLLVDQNGAPQSGFSFRRFPTPSLLVFETLGLNRIWPGNPWNKRYRYLGYDFSSPGVVEQPAGALLAFRREVWETLGGLDESYFPIWFEDVDFCLRAERKGYRAWYEPSVKAAHQGAHSISEVDKGCRVLYWYGSLLRYAAKHFREAGFRGVCFSVMLGAVVRNVATLIRSGDASTGAAYKQVIHFSAKCLIARDGRSRCLAPAALAGSWDN